MQLDFRFCVICLKELSQVKIQVKRGRKRKDEVFKRRKSASSIKLLLTYLLSSRSETCVGVLKDILELSGVEIDEEEGNQLNVSKSANYFRLCENCEDVAERILERQLELEKLQMRIVHDVKSVKEAILRSSGWLGGIEGENGEEAFDHFSRRFCEEDVSSNAKKMFEILKEFQSAVSKTDKASVRVPLVYLEQYSDSIAKASQTLFPGCTATADIVKIEPKPVISQHGSYHEEIFPLLEDNASIDVKSFMTAQMDFDELDASIFSDDYNAPNTDTIISPSNYQTVRKKKETKPHTKFKKPGKDVVKMPNMEPQPIRGSYPCDECSEILRSMYLLCTHKIKKHGASKLPCETCGLQFVTIDKLRRHKRVAHNWTGRGTKSMKKRGPYKKYKVKDPNVPKIILKNEKYECETCNGKFKTRFPSRFEQHLRGHETEEKAFSCDDCNIGFTTKQHFTLHQGRHKGYHKLTCDACSELVNAFELNAHMRTHVDNDTIFPCSYCSQCFASVDRLINHVTRNHKVGNGIKIKCDICGDLFPTKVSMLQHLHDFHKAIEKFKCEFEGCNKTFFQSTSLRLHENFHNGKFSCTKCPKKYYTQKSLDAHQQVHDPGKLELFQCEQCPDTFQTSRRLQAHKMREHGAAKFSCNICGKQYLSYEGLHNHRKKDHEGTGGKRCPTCNKKFPNSYQLRIHTEANHSVNKNYVCEECGKAFRTLNKCRIHKTIHGDKNHLCPHCPKAFTRRDNLVLHLRTHSGEKPYSCDGCGRGFSQLGSMKTHRQKCSNNSSSINPVDPLA